MTGLLVDGDEGGGGEGGGSAACDCDPIHHTRALPDSEDRLACLLKEALENLATGGKLPYGSDGNTRHNREDASRT